jgi:hypothetical protein
LSVLVGRQSGRTCGFWLSFSGQGQRRKHDVLHGVFWNKVEILNDEVVGRTQKAESFM